jgi:hypothetical protein
MARRAPHETVAVVVGRDGTTVSISSEGSNYLKSLAADSRIVQTRFNESGLSHQRITPRNESTPALVMTVGFTCGYYEARSEFVLAQDDDGGAYCEATPIWHPRRAS